MSWHPIILDDDDDDEMMAIQFHSANSANSANSSNSSNSSNFIDLTQDSSPEPIRARPLRVGGVGGGGGGDSGSSGGRSRAALCELRPHRHMVSSTRASPASDSRSEIIDLTIDPPLLPTRLDSSPTRFAYSPIQVSSSPLTPSPSPPPPPARHPMAMPQRAGPSATGPTPILPPGPQPRLPPGPPPGQPAGPLPPRALVGISLVPLPNISLHNFLQPFLEGTRGGSTGVNPPQIPRPQAEPQPITRPGYTRDTNMNDATAVVCPGCNEELAYDPTQSFGSGGRADGASGAGSPSAAKRKSRPRRGVGEHHFWALKNCGHVYCSECFETRRGSRQVSSPFRLNTLNKPTCVVDNCDTEVTNKTSWVGLYL